MELLLNIMIIVILLIATFTMSLIAYNEESGFWRLVMIAWMGVFVGLAIGASVKLHILLGGSL